MPGRTDRSNQGLLCGEDGADGDQQHPREYVFMAKSIRRPGQSMVLKADIQVPRVMSHNRG